MDRLRSSKKDTLDEINYVAVTLDDVLPEQYHVGLLHKNQSENKLEYLHLAWHHKLTNEPPADIPLWVEPNINPARARQVAALCRKVWRSNGSKIPYAFDSPNDCFDEETGKFLLGPTKLGLTCVSFVLAIFGASGLPLIQYSTWPLNRDDDDEWREKMTQLLEKTNADKVHIEAIKSKAASPRCRPEEVVGAACSESIPVNFDESSSRAEKVLSFF